MTSPPPPSQAHDVPAREATTYDKPPQSVLDVLHAPPPPAASLSPTRATALFVTWVEYPPIARVAEPFLRLAGARVEPRNHSSHAAARGATITPCATAYELLRLGDGARISVKLPAGACVDRPVWSADGRRFAFKNTVADRVELWLGDAVTGRVTRVDGARLNPMLGSPVQWLAGRKELLVKLVPDGLGPPPVVAGTPAGPNIKETHGETGSSSTYEARDVLRTADDVALFEHYAGSQLALVDADTLALTRLGAPAPIASSLPAPDGQHILVQTLEKPYSRVTTHERFGRRVEVWDRAGNVVRSVATLASAERVPSHGVRPGPRDFEWRPTEAAATLVWAEALDGGDLKNDVPARDVVRMLRAPFTGVPQEIARSVARYAGISWGADPHVALLREEDDNRHWTTTSLVDVDAPGVAPRKLWAVSTDDHYGDPGTPVMRTLPTGARVLRQDGSWIYLSSDGGSPDGDRPTVDRFDIASGKTERLFRSDRAAYEELLGFADDAAGTFFTWHQSPTEPPNLFVRTLGRALATPAPGEAAYASTARALTAFADPTPAIRAVRRRLVKYRRADGVELSFTLYLPPGHREGTRLPTILHAYPLDYVDAKKAGQVTGSQQLFTSLDHETLLVLAGYAVIEDAAFPIVGDPKKAYDTYLEQLVLDARAAVDEAIAIGVADPERIGVTGHSHGALMTANLLAHTDLFRAGVATSGSYNKTLTAFGFQNERRSVWEAPEVYAKVSPFFTADKLKLPLLLIHGEDDANPGTPPSQSEMFYEALRGNGGTARLVMLPHEPHVYAAMESNEQLLYEMIRWFDAYVKNAPPRGAVQRTTPRGSQ